MCVYRGGEWFECDKLKYGGDRVVDLNFGVGMFSDLVPFGDLPVGMGVRAGDGGTELVDVVVFERRAAGR